MKHGIPKIENINKAIAFSMGFSLFGKVFNFSQSLVVSYAFGTNQSTDILFYILSMVILLTTLLSSINQQIIIPNAIDLRNNTSEEDSKKFIMYVYSIYLLIGIIVTAVLAISPDSILNALSKLNYGQIRENILIIRLIIPVFLLIIINTYIMDVFTSYKYFTLPMVLDMLKNLVIIAFVLLFKGKMSVVSLAMGVLAGNVLQFLVLNGLLFRVLKCRFSIKKYPLSAKLKRNTGFVIAGQLTTFLNGFAVMFLMSGFEAGIYSAMDYSVKINTVFSLAIIGQIVTVVGINILELYTRKDFEKLNTVFLAYLKSSLFFLLPFSFIISMNSENIISILFERGRFSREAAVWAGGFLRYFALTLPYVLINSFVVRLIIAKQIQRTAFFWQTSQSIFNVVVIWAAIHFLGFYGYPIGSVAASYIYVYVLVYFLVGRQFEFINRMEIIKFFTANAVLNLLIYFGLTALSALLPGSGGVVYKLAFLTASGVVYMGLYLAAGWFTGLNRKVIAGVRDKLCFALRKKVVLKKEKGRVSAHG